MSQIQQPGISSPGDKFTPAENKGALLLFFPTALQQGVKTVHDAADAVAATVVRLNDGKVFDNALIFPVALVTQLKGAIPDGIVLGTLDQGENTKGNPPWLLRPFTEAEEQQALAWIAANPRNPIAQPAAPAAQAAPAWGGAPAAPAAPAWGAAPAAPAPNAAAAGWGAPAAAAPAPAWGAPPAAPAPAAAPAHPEQSWGGAQPAAPAPAPAGPAVDPALVAALAAKGINLPPDATQQAAEAIWAVVGNQ